MTKTEASLGGEPRPQGPASEREVGLTAAYLVCIAVSMMFAALTSAMVVRAGISGDFKGIPMPWLLWVNTVVLIASSVALHRFHRAWGLALGLVFLAGQAAAWGQIELSTQIGHAFFYTFTGLHALHLLGGIVAILAARLEAARVYWHFLTGLWVALMIVFQYWRS